MTRASVTDHDLAEIRRRFAQDTTPHAAGRARARATRAEIALRDRVERLEAALDLARYTLERLDGLPLPSDREAQIVAALHAIDLATGEPGNG
jgi:hypothetical protein